MWRPISECVEVDSKVDTQDATYHPRRDIRRTTPARAHARTHAHTHVRDLVSTCSRAPSHSHSSVDGAIHDHAQPTDPLSPLQRRAHVVCIVIRHTSLFHAGSWPHSVRPVESIMANRLATVAQPPRHIVTAMCLRVRGGGCVCLSPHVNLWSLKVSSIACSLTDAGVVELCAAAARTHVTMIPAAHRSDPAKPALPILCPMFCSNSDPYSELTHTQCFLPLVSRKSTMFMKIFWGRGSHRDRKMGESTSAVRPLLYQTLLEHPEWL